LYLDHALTPLALQESRHRRWHRCVIFAAPA
jgi:hypothetical protein